MHVEAQLHEFYSYMIKKYVNLDLHKYEVKIKYDFKKFFSNFFIFCSRSPSFHVEWNIIKYPFQHINTRFQPVSSRGAIVAKYIQSGQIVAVAMNQNRPALTCLLFVSPLTDTVMVSSLKGCGVKDKRSLRGR